MTNDFNFNINTRLQPEGYLVYQSDAVHGDRLEDYFQVSGEIEKFILLREFPDTDKKTAPFILKKGDVFEGTSSVDKNGDTYVTLKTPNGDVRILYMSASARFNPIISVYKDAIKVSTAKTVDGDIDSTLYKKETILKVVKYTLLFALGVGGIIYVYKAIKK